MKNIVLYCAGSCNEHRVLECLKRIIDNVVVVSRECNNNDMDGQLAEILFKTIYKNKSEAIFTIDYYPIVAEVAHIICIPYISWIIDSPHYTLYSSTSKYDSNYIFHFDREECIRLKNLGRNNVFHQRLATDPCFFQSIIENANERECVDVSFLGRSYQNEYDYFARNKGLDEYLSGFFDGLIRAQSMIYGSSIIDAVLTNEMKEKVLEVCNIHFPESYDIPPYLVAESIIEKSVTVNERRNIVASIGRAYGITLYSDREDLAFDGVDFKGYADYETQMPVAFHYSRINLNPTLRTIRSGIPLRILDIMACRGFVISNYQSELMEWFAEGESVVTYSCIEELTDKIGWFLKHDGVRNNILERGYDIIIKSFTYDTVLKEIICVVK